MDPPRSPLDQPPSRRFHETYLGFGVPPARRYDDGVLTLYTAASFDTAASFALVLGPAAEPIVAPAGRRARMSDATRF
jgi:hypothetical protein